LILYFWTSTSARLTNFSRWIIGALFFSWFGDIFLMIPFNQSNFFILGLLSFLVAHILYIGAYQYRNHNQPSLFKSHPIYFLPFIIYVIALLMILMPYLGSMWVPVLVYALVLGSMGVFALNRYRKVNDKGFHFVFWGAVLFILSDSCIAMNKFLFEGNLPFAGVFIMLTYIAGQYAIVEGGIDFVKTEIE
jgi:uncharacterized membrane protein YhhN